MKNLIKLEEIALFILSIYLFNLLDFAWWWFPVLLLLPDLSMLGYLLGPKIGAIVYNVVHHKAIALIIYVLGFYLNNEVLKLCGIIVFAHSTMDRIFDYGLKYFDAFSHTHLGWIGKNQVKNVAVVD